MALTFADTHNMMAYLTKLDASEGFEKIIDFLNASAIQYALIVNPNIYVSYIKQFWSFISVKNVNDVMRLQALMDMKKVIITEDTVREALHLDDAESIDCLPNEEIFIELARMGYEKPLTKLTFYKAFFSNQWKFLIHTILQFTAPTAIITVAPSAARKRKGVAIRDPKETTTPSTIIHSKPKSKDKGKRIMVQKPKPLKKQAHIEQDEAYARELEAELNKNIN
nr:hypothetical protein [Tanacetum cinerariifolium]